MLSFFRSCFITLDLPVSPHDLTGVTEPQLGVMTMKKFLFAVAFAAICSAGPAQADVILSSNFDGSTGASGNGLAGPGSSTVTVSYTGLEATSASALTAVAPGDNGFVFNAAQPNVNQDVVSISGNLNAAGITADPRGFTLTFTPTADYDLGLVDVLAGHFNGNGGFQGFLSDINFSISDSTGILFSASDILDNGEDPENPVGPTNAPDVYDGFLADGFVPSAIAYTFDATGTSLTSGTTYTIAIDQNNLQSGGSFAYFDGFTVNTVAVAIPEPGSFALLSLLGGTAIARRRKQR